VYGGHFTHGWQLAAFDFDNDGVGDIVANGGTVARNDGTAEFSIENQPDWLEGARVVGPYGAGDDPRLVVVGDSGVLFVRRGDERRQYYGFRLGPLRLARHAMVLESERPRHLIVMTQFAGILVIAFDRVGAGRNDQIVSESWLQRPGKNTASVAMARGDVDGDGRPELGIDDIGDEATQHVHLPVGEIKHIHQREDQRQTQRDQRVLSAQIKPVSEHLFHDKPVL
jgi:hypothetical protein